MKGRFTAGWYRFADGAEPGLVMRVRRIEGMGGFVATPYDPRQAGHPSGCGGPLTKALWTRLEAMAAPATAGRDDEDEI